MQNTDESFEEKTNSRLIYNQSEFDKNFLSNSVSEKKSCAKILKKGLSSYDPRKILNLFSILSVIAEYDFRNYFISDIISGITVGVMQIPQALAYGALTSLTPVYGLYTSFYPSLTYIIFGTSRHLSVGTFALVSLMVYGSISKLEAEFLQNKSIIITSEVISNATNESAIIDHINFISEEDLIAFRVKVATSLAFWCGVIQLLFAIFKLGSITKYFSQPMLRGFNTAAAFHVLTTQMQHVFGIYVKSKPRRVFKIVYRYLTLLENITSANWLAFVISCVAVTLIVFTKLYLNVKFKKSLRGIPIPVEIFVLVFGIVFSYFAKLNENFDLAIVGPIQSGLSEPAVPDFSMFTSLISDAIIISVVAVASSISISDMYARKHQYKINSNKEIFALGLANIVGSFFKCFTSAGALARTAVVDSSGGKTQLVTFIASSIMLSVLVWISPLLETLPKACLGSIIIAALTGLLKQMSDLSYYWKLDKVDFTAWIITFLSTVFLDIDIGLCCGLLSVLFLNTYRNTRMNVLTLGQVKNYEIFLDSNKYFVNEHDYIKILKPTQSLYYINCDNFHSKVNQACPLKDSSKSSSIYENCLTNYGCKSHDLSNASIDSTVIEKEELQINKAIILDLSLVIFVDEAAVKILKKIFDEYYKGEIKILFSNANENVRDFFSNMNCEWENVTYPSVYDAISELSESS